MLPLTIKEIQKSLKDKKLTSAEITKEYVERIKNYDPAVNSIITLTEEKAFETAAAIDNSNLDKPLSGAVFVLKDIYLTKGIRTTAASKVLESYIPSYSATVYERLLNAGAILIGKANCDAWAHGASGENSDFGPTCNPWNKEYVAGGSSSGSAAAVASGFATFSMGTDTGGSVRCPASFCGVTGLKPTYGSISRYGVIAMASSLDTMGPIAASVEDIKIIFDVIKGEDGYDSTAVNKEIKKENKKYRIGIPKEYFVEGIDKEVEKLVMDASDVFRKNGVEIVEVSLPHTKYAVATYYIICPAEVSSNLGRYDGIRYGNDRSKFGEEAKRRIMLGTYVLSSGYYDAYYLKAMKVRTKISEDFDNVFKGDIDAILAPVAPTPPFKMGEKTGDPLKMYLSDIYTVSANLAGIPSLSLPCGFTKNGLPVGLQLMGEKFDEETLFNLGKIYQKETDWHLKRPKL